MNETAKTYDAAYWDRARAERIAQERQEDEARRLLVRDFERQAVQAEAVARLTRAIARADAQTAQYRAERGVNEAYYRGKAEGLESALAILRGVISDRAADRGDR